MIEKALIIIVFMYATSFSLLGGQYIMSVYDIELVNVDGTPFESALLDIIDTDRINQVTENLNTINGTEAESNPIEVAAGLVVDLIAIMTGAYIFNVLWLAGIPDIFVNGVIVLYAFMLFRALIGYLRGI
jgi:hypothetical protein